VRQRLQAAGTYHVIAISGGNIAILTAMVLSVLLLCGVTGRPAALITLTLLAGYAGVVTSSPSVWRATLMAMLYLGARLLDHRSPPSHAVGIAASLLVGVRPLDVNDVGFLLTFGATIALIASAHVVTLRVRSRVVRWLCASVAASLAVEIALLPVTAWGFSRVTLAGVVLNLVAVPLMGLVQVGGLVASTGVDVIARPAGWVAFGAARVLVESAGLIDVAPWLSLRIPAPPLWLMVLYYAGLAGAIAARGIARVAHVGVWFVAATAIVTGNPAPSQPSLLRLTVFDVGQGDAALIQLPDRTNLLVDTGGVPYGAGGFDLGSRVLAPALWMRGVRTLDTVLLTHGDPDHIGGAPAVIADFSPRQLWQGIPVDTHLPLRELFERARARGVRIDEVHAGDQVRAGDVSLRVLHPGRADWERQRVRNDDSVVLEVTYRDVAMLFLGDVSAGIERGILPQLSDAPVRVLKIAHHGSRTSTSQELLDLWQPQVAIISCGRGNTFGHPSPEVIARLRASGIAVYRTDLDGEVTVDTDGYRMQVRTFLGGTT
jgi:competence protein ComEC